MTDDTPESGTPLRSSNPDGSPEWYSPAVPSPASQQDAYQQPPAEPTAKRSRAKLFAVVGLVAGMFLLTAAAGGAYYAYHLLLGHEDRATAAYAPQNAYGYAAINVDPTSRAWLDAWDLVKKLGLDKQAAELPKQSLQDDGKDPSVWEQVIKPAVGREVGAVAWPSAKGSIDEPNFALIAMIDDRTKADEALALIVDDPNAQTLTYNGVSYQVNEQGDAAGIVDEALVLAGSEEAFKGIVDAHQGNALNKVDAFNTAANRAADSPLLFAWMNTPAIIDAAPDLEGYTPPAVPGVSGIGDTLQTYRSLGNVTITIKADGSSLRVEALSEGRPVSFPTAAAGSRFAADAPASTLFYSAGADLYASVWQPALEQLDKTGESPLADMQDTLGFDVEHDLLEHLRGPYAMSVDGSGTVDNPTGSIHIASQVDDPAAVRTSLDKLSDWLNEQGVPVVPTSKGFTVGILTANVIVAVDGDALRITGSYGTEAAQVGSLADDADFQQAMKALPDDASMTGYVAIPRIVALVPTGTIDDPTEADALRALGPLVWSMSPDGNGTRSELVLFVKGK